MVFMYAHTEPGSSGTHVCRSTEAPPTGDEENHPEEAVATLDGHQWMCQVDNTGARHYGYSSYNGGGGGIGKACCIRRLHRNKLQEFPIMSCWPQPQLSDQLCI